jgi:hypothetical protein
MDAARKNRVGGEVDPQDRIEVRILRQPSRDVPRVRRPAMPSLRALSLGRLQVAPVTSQPAMTSPIAYALAARQATVGHPVAT